jgi:polysaccharide export outer membrane protein
MLRAFAIFSTALLLSVCAYAQRENEREAPKVKVQLSQVGPSYVIGADDTLAISVWKEPAVTNTLPVRADGMISMPLLNDVQAAGLTPMQLAASITEKLKKYVEDPHVTVIVAAMNSQKIYLTGEVTHGGVMFAPDVPFGPIRDLEDSPQGPIISVPR